MKKVVGVVPARFASTRFPGKPLALISGVPMIIRVLQGLESCSVLSDLFVATDDQRIADVVSAAGYKAIFTQSDLPSGTDRIEAALKNYSEIYPSDIVVNIQGDEPLIQSQMVEELVAPLLADQNLMMSTLAHEITSEELQNPNAVKVVMDQNGNALYFSRFPIPYSREVFSAESAGLCLKHVGLYAYRRKFLAEFCQTPIHPLERAESLEQLRALAMGQKIRVVRTQFRSWGVDTPEDLKKIESQLGGKT